MTDRADVARAMREGSEAGAAGRPASECPYDPAGEDDERLLATLWLRMHRRHVPFPVDFTTDDG